MDLVPFWNAFQVLSSSRSVGMGVGAIPLSAYESYFRIWRITDLEDQLEYIRFVGALDSTYLEHQNESSKNKQKSENKNAKSAPRVPKKR